MQLKIGDIVYTCHYEQDGKLYLYKLTLRGRDSFGRWSSENSYTYNDDELFMTPWQATFARQKYLEKIIAEAQKGLETLGKLEIKSCN